MSGIFRKIKARKFILAALGVLLCLIETAGGAQARRNHAMPPVAAAADNASSVPANASSAPPAGESGESGGGSSGKKVGIGVTWCKVDTANVDFGSVPGISETLISAPGKIHISCGGFTTGTKFCLMFYPTDPDELNEVGNSRVLYGHMTDNILPLLYFNGYMNNVLWGAGVNAGGGMVDYGDPYTGSTGIYVGSGFDLTPEWQLDLRENASYKFGIPAGNYQNKYYVKMNYANPLFGGKASDLCDASRKGGVTVGVSTSTVHFTANVKSACDMITGGALAFGQQISLRNPLSATSTLTVKCSGGMDYTVSANAGTNPDADYTNAMKCITPDSCGASTIQYLLYDDAGHNWNSLKAGGYVQKGSMSAMGADVYNLTAKTLPLDITPPSSTYKDTIIFTLTTTPNQYSLSRRR